MTYRLTGSKAPLDTSLTLLSSPHCNNQQKRFIIFTLSFRYSFRLSNCPVLKTLCLPELTFHKNSEICGKVTVFLTLLFVSLKLNTSTKTFHRICTNFQNNWTHSIFSNKRRVSKKRWYCFALRSNKRPL